MAFLQSDLIGSCVHMLSSNTSGALHAAVLVLSRNYLPSHSVHERIPNDVGTLWALSEAAWELRTDRIRGKRERKRGSGALSVRQSSSLSLLCLGVIFWEGFHLSLHLKRENRLKI